MKLSFKEWANKRDLAEVNIRGMLSHVNKAIPKNPRELTYFLTNPNSMPVSHQQKRRGYFHGKKAAENDLNYATQSENPYKNPKGIIDPADQNFFDGWELGYHTVNKKLVPN